MAGSLTAACLAVAATLPLDATAATVQSCATKGEVNRAGKLCRPAASGSGLVWGAKYKVLVYGDSLGTEAVTYLTPLLKAHDRATIVNRTVPGSAPCDWAYPIALDRTRGSADAVLVEFVGNNISRCQLDSSRNRAPTDSPAYWQEYELEATRMLASLQPNVPVWIAAAPALRSDQGRSVSHKALMLDLMRTVAASRPGTYVIDAGAAVEVPAGSFTAIAPCLDDEPCDNSPVAGLTRVRALDGTHFCPVVRSATVALLKNCPVFSPGARRFAIAWGSPVAALLGL